MISLPVVAHHLFRIRIGAPMLSSSAFYNTIIPKTVKIAKSPTEETRTDCHPVKEASLIGLVAAFQYLSKGSNSLRVRSCAIHRQGAFSDRSRTKRSINYYKSSSLVIYQIG